MDNQNKKMNKRAKIILLVFAFLFIVIIVNLFLYSVCNWKGYREESVKYQKGTFVDIQEKGNFYDRNGRPLTQNLDVCWVYFDRNREVFSKYDLPKNQCPLTRKLAVDLLAKTINVDSEKLYNDIFVNNPRPKKSPIKNGKYQADVVCVAKNLPIKYLTEVNKLNYRGITAEKRVMRYYPEGCMASRILGTTTNSGEPCEGLEKSLKDYTQGQEGRYEAQKDKKGRPMLNTRVYEKDKKGNPIVRKDGANIYLTLDTNIQFYAEKALNKMASLYKPQCAMCVVMDPKNSEVLAIANYPKFDPNNHENYKVGMSKNFAVQNMYEPGSTLKSITTSMALNEGYDINYAFGKCTNVIGVGKRSSFKCDHGPHGVCNCRNIISQSCNIGAWLITKKIGKEKLYEYLNKFGVLGKPGDDFGYEAVGYIKKKPEDWVPIEAANYSFGQGMLTSCLAMCNAYCAIANGGVYNTPKIIKEIKSPEGKVLKKESTKEGNRIITENTAKKMTECLVACVNEGTGKTAKIDGVQSAGKTGSAQIFQNGSYKSGAYLVSFMGYAPAEKPDLVIAVMVDRPQGSTYGAVVAAPVWQETMAKSLKYRQIY